MSEDTTTIADICKSVTIIRWWRHPEIIGERKFVRVALDTLTLMTSPYGKIATIVCMVIQFTRSPKCQKKLSMSHLTTQEKVTLCFYLYISDVLSSLSNPSRHEMTATSIRWARTKNILTAVCNTAVNTIYHILYKFIFIIFKAPHGYRNVSCYVFF